MIINVGFTIFCSRKEHIEYRESDHFFFENTQKKTEIKSLDIVYRDEDTEKTIINKKEIISTTFDMLVLRNLQQKKQKTPIITLFFDGNKYNQLLVEFGKNQKLDMGLEINQFKNSEIRLMHPNSAVLYLFNKNKEEIIPIQIYWSEMEFLYTKCEQKSNWIKNIKQITQTKPIEFKCEVCTGHKEEDILISETENTNIKEEEQIIQGIVKQRETKTILKEKIKRKAEQKQCICSNCKLTEFPETDVINIYNMFGKIKIKEQFPMAKVIFTDNPDHDILPTSYYLEIAGTKSINKELKDDFLFFVQNIYEVGKEGFSIIPDEDINNTLLKIKKMYVFDRNNKLLQMANLNIGIAKIGNENQQLERVITLKFDAKRYPDKLNRLFKEKKFLHEKDKLFSRNNKISDKLAAQNRLARSLYICGGAGIVFAYAAEEKEKSDEDLAIENVENNKD